MTTFDTGAPLTAIATMLATIDGIQSVQVGAPESLSTRVSSWVTVGGQHIIDKASQLLQRDMDYWAFIGYRVKGAEATAETVVATAIDDLVATFYAARKAGTGLFARSTTQVVSGQLDLSIASASEYVTIAGQEIRIFPILLTVTQQQTIS